MHVRKDRLMLGLLVVSSMFLTACDCGGDKTNTTPIFSNKDYAPYLVAFTYDGKPVIIDSEGNPVEFSSDDTAVKATKIERISSIAVVKYRGSNMLAISADGSTTHLPLPPRP